MPVGSGLYSGARSSISLLLHLEMNTDKASLILQTQTCTH